MEKKLTDEEIVKALECCVDDENVNCENCPLVRESCAVIRKYALDLIHRLQGENERLTSLYNGQSGFMTSSIGDLPLTVEGLRNAVDEISRLLIVQGELQDLNAKYYNEAKDLRRENAEQKAEIERLDKVVKHHQGLIEDGKLVSSKEIERLTEESDEMFDRHAKENQAASILIEQRNNEIAELQKKVDILQESHYITYERAVKTTAQKILQDLFYFIDGNNFWLEETGNQVFLIKENDALNFMRKKASEYEVEVEE